MQRVIAVWGLAKEQTERYMETLLSGNCRNAVDVAKVKAAATRDGWHSFRSAVIDNTPPDFSKLLNVDPDATIPAEVQS